MTEILGNKLKINSIDIIPSTINHNDEYLKVSSDETKYEYISNENVKNDLNISYNKNATVNKGYNKTTDLSLTNFSTIILNNNCSNGFKITTNASPLNTSYPLSNLYTSVRLTDWFSAAGANLYVCIETPVPMAYTSMYKKINGWYNNVYIYEPLHFIVEASNDNVNFDILLDKTELAWIPENVYEYKFNENKLKYRYWRLRYPTSGTSGNNFSFCFNGEIEENLYTQTEFQKNKLVSLSPLWMHPLIPSRTTYTDAENNGTVSGSSNITENTANTKIWQAFRGVVDTDNQGWLSASTQTLPCYLAYTPTEVYDEGYYSFKFRKGVWSSDWGWTPLNVQIILVTEKDEEIIVWDRVMHIVSPATFSSEILKIPFKFKQIKWNIISKYGSYVSLGNCQLCKYDKDKHTGIISSDYNIFASNQGNDFKIGGYLHSHQVDFNVSEENPLEVTFPDNTKKTFISLNSVEITPQKKFRLITPIWLTSENYNSAVWNTGLTQDYIDLVNGTCTGIGSQFDTSRYFWRAICADRRTYNDCWLTANKGALGGPIYKWTQMKPKGKYVFKFNTGWWDSGNGYSASEVRVHVRNGDLDSWKTVWNVANIPPTYSTYWWSPVIDIDFEFNQVYFEMVLQNQSSYGGLACCAVFQECDYDYPITTTALYNDIYDRAIQLAYDYQESQNLYLKKDGTTYGLSNLIYRQAEQPLEPKENDIWYNNKQEPLRVYQYKNNNWIAFNDIYLGNFNLINGFIQSFHENPYNDNGTFKNSDCIWTTELVLSNESTNADGDVFTRKNITSNVYHNLNIQDTTKYKAECYLKCIAEDCGYEPGDIAEGIVVALNDILSAEPIPFLTKNQIGIWTSDYGTGWKIVHKYSGQLVNISNTTNWRLVFKIREL